MAEPRNPVNTLRPNHLAGRLKQRWMRIRHHGPSQLQFWILALVIGIAAGFAAVAFRKGIFALQGWLYGTDNPTLLHSFAATLPWYWIVLIPMAGGAVVGLILHHFTPDGRVRSVADVIEGAALSDGRVETRAGIASALASWITLSTGGSTGREGPVVHLVAVISTWVSDRIKADGITGRDLLGCAVAAAVSASFNAPIAGTLFALEVILRHFAVHAFAPIVIASVAGTVISRLEFGDVTEFMLPGETMLAFYVELPAFLVLGLVCGIVAVVLMRAVFWADEVGDLAMGRLRLPRYFRPMLAGLLLGGIAVWFPHVIGVGYETTSNALTGELLLWEAVVFAILKAVAVAITMAGRMGGGIFSPSLMMGALTGLAFGLIATPIFPAVSGSETLYALAGMGAVAAAVLGAPISTTLIVFELTGDWQTGLAVMVAVSLSTALASTLVDRSFFLTQLERRDIHLAKGPQGYLLALLKCDKFKRDLGDEGCPDLKSLKKAMGQGIWLPADATLQTALTMFSNVPGRRDFVTILRHTPDEDQTDAMESLIVGALFHVDALTAYSEALAETAAEEHS